MPAKAPHAHSAGSKCSSTDRLFKQIKISLRKNTKRYDRDETFATNRHFVDSHCTVEKFSTTFIGLMECKVFAIKIR
jgi:hypothetical protein